MNTLTNKILLSLLYLVDSLSRAKILAWWARGGRYYLLDCVFLVNIVISNQTVFTINVLYLVAKFRFYKMMVTFKTDFTAGRTGWEGAVQ